jgi:hypothetical protein
MRPITRRHPAVALFFAVAFCAAAPSRGQDVRVTNQDTLRAALKQARPGTRILLAPGSYGKTGGGAVHGTAERPVIIESADPQRPAVFEGGQWGLYISKCSHLVLRNFTVRNTQINGINLDDGDDAEDPSHHVVIENLTFSDVGPRGNNDCIKLSGVTDFTVRNCTADGWGGSGIDMVGCHRGLIERCAFRGKQGTDTASGVQMKGGSSGVTVRDCTFLNINGRSVNIGGTTDRGRFRPRDATCEAKDLTVEGCRFDGSDAPVAFAGIDGSTDRYNTIYEPRKWVVRILQDSTYPTFVACRNGRFENNIVVYNAGGVRAAVNVGDGTKPDTFTFANNLWYAKDDPARSKPRLPVTERGGIYNVDPKLKDPANGDLTATQAPANVGAHALPNTQASN